MGCAIEMATKRHEKAQKDALVWRPSASAGGSASYRLKRVSGLGSVVVHSVPQPRSGDSPVPGAKPPEILQATHKAAERRQRVCDDVRLLSPLRG
jgi:hypothetical protein